MTAPDPQLFRRWGHAFEEDHDGVLVYRPADHAFAPARGRDGLEFRGDGTVVDWVVGPGDANQPRTGSWHSVGGRGVDGGVQLRLIAAGGEQRVVELLTLTHDRLELRAVPDRD